MRLELIKRRPFGFVAGLGAMTGLLVGLTMSPALPPDTAKTNEPAWSLPPISSTVRGDENDFALVRQSPLWKSAAEVNARNAPNWKIVGVTAQGDKRTALIQVQGTKELIHVSNGDSLPGDGRVVEVGRFGMRINIFGCDIILRLYTPGQRSPTPNCPQVSNPTPTSPVPPASPPTQNPGTTPVQPAGGVAANAAPSARPVTSPTARAAASKPAPPSNR